MVTEAGSFPTTRIPRAQASTSRRPSRSSPTRRPGYRRSAPSSRDRQDRRNLIPVGVDRRGSDVRHPYSDQVGSQGATSVTFDTGPTATVTVNPRGTAFKDGTARVSGTYSCSTNANPDLSDVEGRSSPAHRSGERRRLLLLQPPGV